MTDPFPLRPAVQGLVVVDMQNDFVREGAPQEVPDARAIIPVVQRLIAAFRRAGRPLFFTRFVAGPERTLMWTWSPECGEGVRSCWRGHHRTYADRPFPLEGPAVIDELQPGPGEEVIDKYGYGAFSRTPLADALRARKVEQLVVTGTVTQICVEDTVRGAFADDFETVVISDAVASFDPELHAASLRSMAMKFAFVTTADVVLGGLEGSTDRGGTRWEQTVGR